MATNLAEAFVRLYVEDQVTPVLNRLPGAAAAKAGEAGEAVTAGFREGSEEAVAGLSDLEKAAQEADEALQRKSKTAKVAGGAAKTLGGETDKAGGMLAKFGLSGKSAADSGQGLAKVLGLINPQLGAAAQRGVQAGAGLGKLGALAGPVGIGIAALGTALTLFSARALGAQQATIDLALAQRKGDFGAVAALFDKNAEALARYEERAKETLQPVTGLESGFRKFFSTIGQIKDEVFGQGFEALTERAKELGAAAQLAFDIFERPKINAQALKEGAALLERQGKAAQQNAVTAGDLTAATDTLMQAKRNQAQADHDLLAIEIRRFEHQARDKPERRAEFEARITEVRRKQSQITQILALDEADLARERDKNLRALAEAERKHTVALQTQQEDSQRNRLRSAVGFAAEMAKTRTTSAIQQTQIVHQQALDEAQIDEQAFAARRARLQREAELLAQQPQTKETIEQARALQVQLGALDEERAKSREALAGRILQLETQLAQQVRAVQEAERTARKALGDVTIAEERARLDSIIGDVTRSEQERITAITNRVQIAKQAEQGYWDFLKARGDVTVQDEVDRQQKIVGATKAGTAERLAEETKLAAAQKALRDQALSAGERLRQEAIESLKAEGKQRISNMDIERRSAALQQGHLETLAQAAAGAAVDVDKLQKAAQMAPTFKQLRDTGVSAADAMRSAFTATTKQAGLAKTATSALESELAGLQKELADIKLKEAMRAALDAPKQIAEATAKAYSAVLGGTDDFMKTWSNRIQSGASKISDDLVQVFLTKTTKRLQEESRRL